MSDSKTAPEDLRQSPRIEYDVEVGVQSENNFFTGFIQNISEGGLFVATHDPLSIGAELSIKFTLPNLNQVVTAQAIVRWIRPYDARTPDAIPGMGIQFIGLIPDEATAAINQFIKQREPEFFED